MRPWLRGKWPNEAPKQESTCLVYGPFVVDLMFSRERQQGHKAIQQVKIVYQTETHRQKTQQQPEMMLGCEAWRSNRQRQGVDSEGESESAMCRKNKTNQNVNKKEPIDKTWEKGNSFSGNTQ